MDVCRRPNLQFDRDSQADILEPVENSRLQLGKPDNDGRFIESEAEK